MTYVVWKSGTKWKKRYFLSYKKAKKFIKQLNSNDSWLYNRNSGHEYWRPTWNNASKRY